MDILKIAMSLLFLGVVVSILYAIIIVMKECREDVMLSRARNGDVCANCHKRLRFLDGRKISSSRGEKLCDKCYEIYINKLSNQKDI